MPGLKLSLSGTLQQAGCQGALRSNTCCNTNLTPLPLALTAERYQVADCPTSPMATAARTRTDLAAYTKSNVTLTAYTSFDCCIPGPSGRRFLDQHCRRHRGHTSCAEASRYEMIRNLLSARMAIYSFTDTALVGGGGGGVCSLPLTFPR